MTLLIFPDPLKRRAKAAHAKKPKMVRPQQSTQSLPAPQQYYPQGVPPGGASTLTLPAQLHISVPTPPPPGQMPWTSNSPPIMPPRPANPGWAGAAMYQHHPDQSGMFAPPMAAASTPYLPSFPSSSSSSSPPLGSISPPQPTPPQLSNVAMAPWASNANLASTSMANLSGPFASASTQLLNQSAALFDVISSKFDDVITGIDGDSFSGEEHDLFVDDESSIAPAPTQERSLRPNTTSKTKNLPPNRTLPGSNYFSKTWLYANSRLPPHLPPLKVYMPTWPLLCLAAQYSERAYGRPEKAAEAATHVDADWKRGTKAMVLKSVPVDDMNTVVFAIRGSQTFMDWAVNFRPAPSSPVGFLDDPGNLCHTGFLNVARSMVAPVSARLRTLLSENPARSNCSLLITGHSAGGAVAALLYAHMMSTTVESELNHLTGFFKRVHCVTFGAPPVSLLPLTRNLDKAHRKSVFFSFVNEGDPVCRADRETVRSLLKLYVSAPPPMRGGGKRWDVPTSVLSLAGRVVVLRVRGAVWGKGKKAGPGKGPIEAVVVDDEMLRRVVYGDPMMHMMNVYSKRLEELATRAVTAQDY